MSELWICDDNWKDHVGDGRVVEFDGHLRQLCARPRVTAYGACAAATAFPVDQLIPRSRWDAIIAKKDEEKSWLDDLMQTPGAPAVKDQDGENYCHGYGPTSCVEVQEFLQGCYSGSLSAESVAGPVTDWRNIGWDPEDDLQQLITYGACPAEYMDKPWSRNPRLWKPGWEKAALDHRVLEWWDLDIEGRVFDAYVTAAMLNILCAAGYRWWSHEVHGAYRVRKQNGRYGVKHRNSWGANYGEDGFFWLEEGRGTPSIGLFGVRAVTAKG